MKVNTFKLQQLTISDLIALVTLIGKLLPFYTQVKKDKLMVEKLTKLAGSVDAEMKTRIDGLMIYIEWGSGQHSNQCGMCRM